MRLKRQNFLKYFIFYFIFILTIYYMFGVGDYIQTQSFDKEFNYPLNTDIVSLIEGVINKNQTHVEPINYYPYKFLSPKKCMENYKPDLVILVKSAIGNFNHREAIRKTWGSENSYKDLKIQVLFFLGIDTTPGSTTQRDVNNEAMTYKDIVQSDFIDNYYNNTIKTMMSFRWAFEFCPYSDHYLFSDDDMYISVINLLNYVKNPYHYPSKKSLIKTISNNNVDNKLYAGYLFESAPHRYVGSKWRVTTEEYPWDKWPPYITAGAYVVSNKAMTYLYLGSLYVKHFRFDDIYLAIVAKKTGIVPCHCNEFYYHKKRYSEEDYKYLIASHGYGDGEELISVWNRQRYLGYA